MSIHRDRQWDATLYIHTYIPLTLYPLRGSRGILDIPPRHTFYKNYAMKITADVTDGKPIDG
jgi:hypothetical protein